MLNEYTLWAGNPKEDIAYSSPEVYQKARELALKGEFLEAQKTLDSNFSGDYAQRYLALADLIIESDFGDVSKYKIGYKSICRTISQNNRKPRCIVTVVFMFI